MTLIREQAILRIFRMIIFFISKVSELASWQNQFSSLSDELSKLTSSSSNSNGI